MSVSFSENSSGLSDLADHMRRGMPWFHLMPGVACRGLPSSWWYPKYAEDEAPRDRAGQQEREHQIQIALRICNSCQYQNACVEWAIDHNELGIWGATFEGTRMKIRKQRAREA